MSASVNQRKTKRRKAYKKLKRHWRRYNAKALIEDTRDYLLNGLNQNGSELGFLRRAPWVMFLLIKWIYEDGEAKLNKGKLPTRAEAQKVREEAFEITKYSMSPREFPSTHMFMRAISNQQFGFQKELNSNELGRQWLMFARLEDDHQIKEDFKELIGLDVSTFLRLAYYVQVAWITGHGAMSKSWFDSIGDIASNEDVDSFLSALARSHSELREMFRLHVYHGDGEEFELTRLVEYPLLKKGETYHNWNPFIFGRAINQFVYRKLREQSSERFMQTFGEVFERYCEDGIKDSGADFITEEDIKGIYGKKSQEKVIDFLVNEEDALVLIDSKGVELKNRSLVGAEPAMLNRDIKDSIFRGVVQGHRVYRNRKKIGDSTGWDLLNKEPFIIVVTYHEMNLKGGKSYYEYVDSDKLGEIQGEFSEDPIELDNIFFLSIDCFDRMCEWRRKENGNLGDLLRQIRELNNNTETAKFVFGMHLADMGVGEVERLGTASDEVIEPIIEAAQAYES